MKLRTQALIGIVLLGLTDCGKTTEPPPPPPSRTNLPSSADAPHEVKVEGHGARFGSQCPLGTYSDPVEVPILLWSCPIGRDSIALKEALQPMIFQMDCKKKTLDVRGDSHSGRASTWEVMPDGSFYFTMNAGKATLQDDGSGSSNCSIPLIADMWGKVDCSDQDKVTIRLETVWWLGKDPYRAGSSRSPVNPTTPANPECKIPKGCYFHTITTMKQCF